jgi:cytochrome c oxidase subunit II
MKTKLKRQLTLLAFLLAASTISARPAETPRRIEIVASRFSYQPNQITLKKGEPIVLVLRSTDVTHGLKINELDIKTEVKKGQDTELALTPSQAGHFEGKCAHFCGRSHGSMTFVVDVVE